MASITDRIKHAWNAFTNEEERTEDGTFEYGASYGHRPDRVRFRISNDRSLVTSIYTRLAIDVASVDIRHVRVDNNNRYVETIDSGLNNCLNLEANIDQEARAFRQDIAMTMFEEGVCAIVPVDTSLNPIQVGGYEIHTLRVGKVVAWYPRHVRVLLYNDRTGLKQEIYLPKENVAIVENPLYSVMNEPNSTLQRLIRKLGMLDSIDEQSSSGKLDLIIQLPYVIKSEARRIEADRRRNEIETQLKGSKYGVAYTDGTEKITQLNRPVENNLLEQVKTLTDSLYSQLGLTKEVFDGTADEASMRNYMNRAVKPILDSIVESMARKFLTKTARTQKQAIQYFIDPFELVPVSQVAEIADKLTRNEIVSANEIRSIIGMRPSDDPKADELRNSNMPDPNPPDL